MGKIFEIMGRSSCGKDTIYKSLIERGKVDFELKKDPMLLDENLESNVSNIFIIKFLKYSLQKMIIVVIIKIKLILIL